MFAVPNWAHNDSYKLFYEELSITLWNANALPACADETVWYKRT